MICPNCQCVFVFALPEGQPKVEKPTCPACGQKSDFERTRAQLLNATTREVERRLGLVLENQAIDLRRLL